MMKMIWGCVALFVRRDLLCGCGGRIPYDSPSLMSFFGFEQTNRLQQEKQKFLEGKVEQEDLAVYTWGEESYDELGDALLEGGDELNDETFGGTEQVGKFYLQITLLPLLTLNRQGF